MNRKFNSLSGLNLTFKKAFLFMAWQVSKRVWDHANDITQNDKLMLLALAEKANEHGICKPRYDTSYDTLAQMVGVTRRSAIRIIDKLVELKHIIKIEATGRGNSNTFIVICGLSADEIKCLCPIKSDASDTLYNEETATEASPKEEPEEKRVTPVTQKGDASDTLNPIKSDTGVTQTIIKTPSIPSNTLKGQSRKSDKPKKTREPPSPAFQKYTDITDYYSVTKHWRNKMAEIVGDAPGDLEFWGKVVEGYVGTGWFRGNVKAMLEFYQRREIPGTGKNGANQNGTHNQSTKQYSGQSRASPQLSRFRDPAQGPDFDPYADG